MPQQRPKILTVRLTAAGMDAIRDKAKAWGLPLSQVVRMMLSYAAQHMPPPRKRPDDDPFS